MSLPGSATLWIDQVKAGDSAGAHKLWERYFQRLVGLARKKLQDKPRRAADEEDVALSAFASFCRRAEQGHFPQIQDRDNLWRLLFVLTVRKALNRVKHESRQKRGGAVQDVPLSPNADLGADEIDLEQIMGREPTPDFAAQVAEECQRLLVRLGDTQLRWIALWKMEGYTTEEIAAKLRRAPRTIERRLQLIRKT
jgi:DNA-directed RNA polymerase specialized sigma24 family protein